MVIDLFLIISEGESPLFFATATMIFYIFEFDEIKAYTIKLTKDAELDINDDITDSFIKNVSKSLKKRKEGQPVRFLYDREIPVSLLKILTRKLKLKQDDATIPGAKENAPCKSPLIISAPTVLIAAVL